MPDDQTASSARELIDVVRAFAESDLRELSVSSGGIDLFISRNPTGETPAMARPVAPPAPAAEAPAAADTPAAPAPDAADAVQPAAASSPPKPGLTEVRSPAVGIFYRRPSPDKDPFVEVGTRVAAGDPVGTIEVMKMYTAVTTPVAGVVVEVSVPDGGFVEHDQVVVFIDESA